MIRVLVMILLASTVCFAQKHVIALLDNSGSFEDYFRGAKRNISMNVSTLVVGDKFNLRMITEESFTSGDELLLEIMSPSSTATLVEIVKQKKLKKHFLNQMNGVEFKHSSTTDIIGAIYAASNTFQASRHTEKVLAIYSDMVETKNRKDYKQGPNLHGVRVICLFIPREGSIAEYDERLQEWKTFFENAGASTIDFVDESESEHFTF